MANYNLQPNESIIIKSENVLHADGSRSNHSDELILTNLSIVLITKGAFGNIKGILKYPINQVKIHNGRAQAILNNHNNLPRLDIYFINGFESFEFTNKKEVLLWTDKVNRLLTGEPAYTDPKDRLAIPGTELIATTLKDTFDTVKGVFGKSSENTISTQAIKVTKKCMSCGAPIIGNKGQTVTCRYCDSVQNL